MNSFGLGLVLNFTDNASPGMASASENFQKMSGMADEATNSFQNSATNMASIAYSLNSVGSQFMGAGSAILNVFGGVSKKIIDTGMDMQNYRLQMSALFGGAKQGEEEMNKVKQYAMSSVFNLKDLIPAITMMKAVGIDAMQTVTTSSGKAKQKLLDYASDIAAMVPNMRNSYGTGVQAAMGAMKEYIAEGNALSLKRGAGLDIKGILGEDKGDTVAKRTQQIADLVEKLHILGYTSQLAGTPTQRLSNMEDALFNSLSKIADSGVFSVFSDILTKVSNLVFGLVNNEKTFNLITGIVADVVKSLLTPVDKIVTYLTKNAPKIITWISNHKQLTEAILKSAAAVGVFLVAGGAFLKFMSTLTLAFIGLKYLKSLPTLLGGVTGSLAKFALKAAPMIIIAGLIYKAWSSNFMGIQDTVKDTASKLTKILPLVGDAWKNNKISPDDFIKARQLGVLPFLQAILNLRREWDLFSSGFKQGFSSFFSGMGKVLKHLQEITGSSSKAGKALDKLMGFLANTKGDHLSQIGKAIGEIVAALFTIGTTIAIIDKVKKSIMGIGTAVKIVTDLVKKSSLVSTVSTIFGAVTKGGSKILSFGKNIGIAIGFLKDGESIGTVLSTLFPTIAGGLSSIGTVLMTITPLFGLPVIAVLGIAAAIAVVVGLIIKFHKQIGDFFNMIGSKAQDVFSKIASVAQNVFSTVGGALNTAGSNISNFAGKAGSTIQQVFSFSRIIGASLAKHIGESVQGAFSTFFSAVQNFAIRLGKSVQDLFGYISKAVMSNPLISSFVNLATSVFQTICNLIKAGASIVATLLELVWGFIQIVGANVAGIAQSIGAFFQGLFSTVVSIAQSIWGALVNIASGIWDVIKAVIEHIVGAVQGIWSVISNAVYLVYEIVRTIVLAIIYALEQLWNVISGAVIGIWNQISGFFQAVWGFLQQVGQFIATVVQRVWAFLSPIFQWIYSAIQGIGNAFSQFFSFVWNSILVPLGSNIMTLFQNIASTVTSILQGIFNFFSTVFGWINNNILQPFFNFMVGVFRNISAAVRPVIQWIGDRFCQVANGIRSAWSSIASFFQTIFGAIGSAAHAALDWIANIISHILDGIHAIGNFFGSGLNSAGNFVKGIGDKLQKLVGLRTGGYVKTTGIAVLHPDEVVVNDDTTQRLQKFLGQYEDTKNTVPKSAEQAIVNNIYPTLMQDVPVTAVPMETQVADTSISSNVTNNNSFVSALPQTTPVSAPDKEEVHNDYSVHFEAGSVVLQLSNATDAELEKAADKLMKIIARKQQLHSMAVRN